MADELSLKVASGFEATDGLISEVLRQNREEAVLLGVISTRLDLLTKSVEHLLAVVEQGNGRPAVTAQLAIVGQTLQDLQRWRAELAAIPAIVERIKTDVDSLKARPVGGIPEAVQIEGIRGKWQTIALLIGSLFGSSGLILGILNYLK
jgi:hypothetical protein